MKFLLVFLNKPMCQQMSKLVKIVTTHLLLAKGFVKFIEIFLFLPSFNFARNINNKTPRPN
jgi:hypothetical protein